MDASAFPNEGPEFHAGSDGKVTLLKSAKLAKSSNPNADAGAAAAPAGCCCCGGAAAAFLGDVKDRRVTVVVPLDETLAMLNALDGWNPESKPDVYDDAW